MATAFGSVVEVEVDVFGSLRSGSAGGVATAAAPAGSEELEAGVAAAAAAGSLASCWGAGEARARVGMRRRSEREVNAFILYGWLWFVLMVLRFKEYLDESRREEDRSQWSSILRLGIDSLEVIC